jgi:outer membrane murein-binding lipoprotein Lpp
MEISTRALAAVVLATTILTGGAAGQPQSTQTPAATQVSGEVTALDAQSRQISLKPDQGEAVTATVGDSTSFRRIPAGPQDLTKATRIAFSDLGVGDRIVAIGQKSDDQRKVAVRTVIVMRRSDLAQKRQREQEEWQKRGMAGTASAIDPGANTFNINW